GARRGRGVPPAPRAAPARRRARGEPAAAVARVPELRLRAPPLPAGRRAPGARAASPVDGWLLPRRRAQPRHGRGASRARRPRPVRRCPGDARGVAACDRERHRDGARPRVLSRGRQPRAGGPRVHVRGARGACAVPRPRPRRVCARAALEPPPRSLAHEAAAPSRRPPAPSVGGRAPAEARLRCPDGGVAPRPAPGRRARSARAGAPAPPAPLRSVARLAAPRPPPARGRQPPEGALDAPHVPALGGGVPGRMRRRLLLVLVLAAGVFVWRLGRPGFSDTEGMFAEPAREMVETGDWVTPRMNGEPFLTKPPLAYWLAATVMAVRGPTEYARLVPALAALGTVAVTGALGTVLFGEAAGLAAAVVLVTSAGFLVEARLLRADMLLVLAITTVLWAAASVRRRPSLGMAMLFWVALGLGTLDKGLVALVIPVAALALAVVVEGGAAVRAVVARLRAPLGLAVLAAIVVPWHLAAGARNPGFLWDYVVNQHLLVFFDAKLPRDSIPDSLAVFWTMFFVRTLPWSLLLPAAAVHAWRW